MPKSGKKRKAAAMASSSQNTPFRLPDVPHHSTHTIAPNMQEIHEWDRYIEALQTETIRAIGQRAGAAAIYRHQNGYECPTRADIAAEQARRRAQAQAQSDRDKAANRARARAQLQAQIHTQVQVAQAQAQVHAAAAAAASSSSSSATANRRELLPVRLLQRDNQDEVDRLRAELEREQKTRLDREISTARLEREQAARLERIRNWQERTTENGTAHDALLAGAGESHKRVRLDSGSGSGGAASVDESKYRSGGSVGREEEGEIKKSPATGSNLVST